MPNGARPAGSPWAACSPRNPWWVEMIQAVQQAGTLRCRWVACDEAVGRDTTRRDHIAGLGLWYDAEVPHDTQVWRERPATMVPAGSGRGRQPNRGHRWCRRAQGATGGTARPLRCRSACGRGIP